MRNPTQVVLGGLLALFGAIFFLQGVNVLKGSGMSNTVTWSILGPLIFLAGLALLARGEGNGS